MSNGTNVDTDESGLRDFLVKELFPRLRRRGIVARPALGCCELCSGERMNSLFQQRPSFLGGAYWTDQDEETLEKGHDCSHPHLYLGFLSSPKHPVVPAQNIGNTILGEFLCIPQKEPRRFFARWSGHPLEKVAFWEAVR